MRPALVVVLLSSCAAPRATGPNEPRPVSDVSPLEKQLAANPDDARVNLELGDRATSVGDFLRAEQYYARADALGIGEDKVAPRIIKVLVMARRYDEALERCHRRLGHVPEDRTTRLVEAAILEALERPRDAERDLTTLVRTKPDDPTPYLALGKLYRDSYHDAARARRMFEKYVALAPKGSEVESIRYQLEETEPEPAPELAP